MTRIAVVGMACRYPDATSPGELWENALAGRRAFRRLPDERMRLDDYWDPDPATPDRFYASKAAVVEGYEFDRIAYRVAGSTYRSTDLTHWLALDVAATALADAGFPMGEGLPREGTGVVVGNSLTGEFARANLMRLRWPYVRRTMAAALREQGWDDGRLSGFLDRLESAYKAPFPPVDEDTLAGGLSNTIAGRICNHFDLKGGGFTVDGACSSSLLSVATAAKALVDRDLDVAVAGGVDLSIDPFEIIGFAKTGALATGEMRVYDRRSSGFWPGEGCGMVVLMREPEARAAGHRVYATIAGWGISSDGRGGITRPEISGYRLALRRAYRRAGFGIETVGLFEGHGTGTRVGDTTELTALTRERLEADPQARPAAIGSIKAMIGHTKAAAGVAGLIKASMAVYHGVIPPSIGCADPHEILTAPDAALRVPRRAEPWPEDGPARAGVTAMGFGGINTHIVLESGRQRRRSRLDPRTRALAGSVQDVELLLADAASPAQLLDRLETLAGFAPAVSYAELADLAATLHRELRGLPWRAAVVVSSPEDAERRLRQLCAALEAGETRLFTPDGRCFLGHVDGPGRIGYLFPGQGSGRGSGGGALRRRFAEAEEIYRRTALPAGADSTATEVAQPRIVTGSLAGLRALASLGIEATVAVGHSLGELSALHWAGALDEESLVRVATLRGRAMARHSAVGTMASLAAPPEAVERIIADRPVVVAGYNGPEQTVVAGPVDQVREILASAESAGIGGVRLAVSHAFHSPLVAPAAEVFGTVLAGERFAPPHRRVISTVTGEALAERTDLAELLRRQITDPVLFTRAVSLAAKEVDLFVEVGPGRVLTGLAAATTDLPVVALDTDDESLAGVLGAVGAAYVAGAATVDDVLFRSRLVRPLRVGAEFRFFASPCERAPASAHGPSAPASALVPSTPASVMASATAGVEPLPGPPPGLGAASAARSEPAQGEAPATLATAAVPAPERAGAAAPAVQIATANRSTVNRSTANRRASNGSNPNASNSNASNSNGSNPDGSTATAGAAPGAGAGESTTDLLRRLAAERAELPVDLVHPTSLLLDDLHLSSITVGQVVNEAARLLGLPPAQAPTNFALATVRELAEALDELSATVPDAAGTAPVPAMPGAAEWARAWRVDLDELPVPPAAPAGAGAGGAWQVHAEPDSPLAAPLRQALERSGAGPGVLVCLPPDCRQEHLALALAGARAALSRAHGDRFVLVQHGRGAAGLAKSLHLEAQWLRTTVVHLPAGAQRAVEMVVREVRATTGFAEAYYDHRGTRRVPTLRALPIRPARQHQPLDGSDVLLVTGGGKGITAECALALARDSGARLALLGRADPEADEELAANLRRIADAGVPVHYLRADVTDPAQLRRAVAALPAGWGPVTAVLHGAGRNEPAALGSLDLAAVRDTFAPKVDGLRHVLEAVHPDQLKLLVTLGSIIGRAGLRGEAHYATANEWLAEATTEVGRRHPNCRAVCLEWSVWSGVGMGERLSVVESLERDGVTALTPDQGVSLLRRVLTDPDAPEVVVISGRTEGIHTVRYGAPPLPLLRFVERPLLRYHGVELVTEVELGAGTDRYLADHALDGNLLFPAVFGMEAMAQVAAAVTGEERVPAVDRAAFLRPIVVPPEGSTTIRVAATVTGDGVVDAAIYSAETGFTSEHFRARLRYGDDPLPDGGPARAVPGLPPVPLDPATDLYGDVLFQGARFQRLRRYRRAAARHVDVEVAADDRVDWFAGYLPDRLLLGDPGVRDALMHGNQVCVPDATLLPSGIDRLWPGGGRIAAGEPLSYSAVERNRDGDTYVYDIALRSATGEVVERWEGLRLRAVRKKGGRGPWTAPLLGPYLERALGDLGAVGVAVAVEPDDPGGPGGQPAADPDPGVLVAALAGEAAESTGREAAESTGREAAESTGRDAEAGSAVRAGGDAIERRRAATALAAGRATGAPVEVRYRPDGCPELAGGQSMSAAHAAGLTLCVTGPDTVGCDLEPVVFRTDDDWHGLLGRHAGLAGRLAEAAEESRQAAATRVWAAVECLRKAGRSTGAPLALLPVERDAWVTFSSAELRIATLVTAVRGQPDPVVFAVLFDGRS